ncbi:hypothetical protein KR200_009649, partial [Drosophila serrata]
AAFSSVNTVASVSTMVANSIVVTNPSSVTLSRNLGIESTRLLFMGNNFQNGRSDQDIFYDCEDMPVPAVGVGRAAGPSRCQLDDPAAIREALERAANATQMLLKNFDKSGGWNHPTGVTLELTARLVNPKKSKCGRLMHGKPVTVQMPLEFNSQGGKIPSCQKRKIEKIAPPKARAGPVCQCRPQHPVQHVPMNDCAADMMAPNAGKSSEQFHPCESAMAERSRSTAILGSCGDSSSRSYACQRSTCCCRFDPDEREVISICYIPISEPQSESEQEVSLLEERIEEKPVVEELTHMALYESESASEESESSEYSSEEAEKTEKTEMPEREIAAHPQPEPKLEVPPSKRYYLALPQNKDFSNCSPCRFDPSPIMDEDGNVFCPGNCGCCLCPWMKRSLATNWEHINVKVCRCVQRGTIFTKFEDREVCSQASYFDFCPCREKAEAKYLELYHREMWSKPDAIRGREIRLAEIKELLVPVPHPTE